MKTRSHPRRHGHALAAAVALSLVCSALPGVVRAQGWKTPTRRAGTTERPVPAVDPYRPEKGGIYSNLGLVDRLSRDAVSQVADSLRIPSGTQVTIMSSVWHEANWFVGSLLAEELTRRGCVVRTGDWGTPPDTTRRVPQPPRPGVYQPPPAAPAETSDLEDSPPDSAAAVADSSAAEGDPGAVGQPPEDEPPAEQSQPATPASPVAAVSATRPVYPRGDVVDLRLLEFGVSYPSVGRKFFFGPVRFSRVGGVFLQASLVTGPEGGFQRMVSAERHRVDRLTGSQRTMVEGASYPFAPPMMKAPSLARYIEPAVVVGIVSSLVYLFYANQN